VVSGFSWTAAEVSQALGAAARGEAPAAYTAVSTDTRQLLPGALFVALEGESFDGHGFLAAAQQAGARGAVVRHLPQGAPAQLCYYLVDNTLHALGRLARHRRRALKGRVVAVAGSNGKTTTKDLLRAALGGTLQVHATQGNLNNQVGVPLTLLAAPDYAQVVVVETGTNEPGEIDLLGAIVEPDLVVITSIGEEHLEGLGSLQGVLEEELAILRHLRPAGVALVAEDPPELPARAGEQLGPERLRVAGFGPLATLRPDQGESGVHLFPDGTTHWAFRRTPVDLPLPGLHNVRNALLALGAAAELNVPVEAAAAGVRVMPSPDMRSEWRQVGSLRVLADCYNANPPSTRAALELLASLPTGTPKVAVIGTMRELGEMSEPLHRVVAELALNRLGRGIDRLVATGEFVAALRGLSHDARVSDPRVIALEDPLAAYAALRPLLEGGETILLKGSRGVALERLLPLLERDFAEIPAQPAASTARAGA
jgi:UDP-N-acetylmuramoyl-tripeptide--D-alanyl-D-alanine ligase